MCYPTAKTNKPIWFYTSKQNCKLKSHISSLSCKDTLEKFLQVTRHFRHSLYIPTLLLLGSRNSKENVCPKPGTLISTPSGGSVVLLVRLYTSLGGEKKREKNMKRVILPHDNSQLLWVLKFLLLHSECKCCYPEEKKMNKSTLMAKRLHNANNYFN